MSLNFELEQRILLLNCEKKDKVNIYTYVNLDKNETLTTVGVKADLPLHKPLVATFSLKIERENFELKDGTKKYVNQANLFITAIKEVK